MQLDNITENEIREQFRSYEFQKFMFEMLTGSSKDENGELYNYVYKYELEEAEDEMIYLIQAHLNHNIPLNKNSIISFVLRHIVDNLLGDDLNCHRINFYALCNQLYYMVFEKIRKYYKSFMIKENT